MPKTIFIALIPFLLFACKSKTNNDQDSDITPVSQVTNELQIQDSFFKIYGLEINSSSQFIDTGKIATNSIFNDVFKGYSLSDQNLNIAIEKTKEIFSFKQMRAGQVYNMVYHESDTGKKADYFIYHHLPNKKLIISLRDSIYAYWFDLQTDTVLRTLYANIDRTLYHSIIDANISYDLGVKLSEVFAWQVDFFKIDSKDFFKVIFEEYQVEGSAFEIGKVKAAEFYHKGDTFYAFNFKQDDVHSYFDQNGKSLRKAFLKAPLKYTRISSRYTMKRYHPVQRRWKAHLGTDYAAPTGTPIRSVGDGVVLEARYSRYNGNYVKIKHNETYTTQYLHMSKIASNSRAGKHVRQGDVIGYVGSTGLATGPHLCFRFWKNGVQIDPFSIKVPPSIPLDPKRMPEFQIFKKDLMTKLDGLELAKSVES